MAEGNNPLGTLKTVAVILAGFMVVTLMMLAIVSQYSKELRTDTTYNNLSITLKAPGIKTLIGTSGQYPYPQTLTGCKNTTNAVELGTSNYTLDEGGATGGYITVLPGTLNFTSVNCSSLTYLASSTAQAAADKYVVAFGIFATFASVVILAMIGLIIIRLFKKVE